MVGTELDNFVGIAEVFVMVADKFQDVDEVSADSPEAELIIIEDKAGTAVPDETVGLPSETPVLPELFSVAPAELEIAKGGRQHEDEREVSPPDITATTTLDETDTRVGVRVLPVPSSVGFGVGAKLLEDG